MSALYIPQTGEWLARFRAHPALVRVGVRRAHRGYVATVSRRDQPECSVSAFEAHAPMAVLEALEAAEAEGFPGIDLSMGHTYSHPWGGLS
jgi:hypothetical protein